MQRGKFQFTAYWSPFRLILCFFFKKILYSLFILN